VFVPQAQVARIRVGAAARTRVDGVPEDVPGHVERLERRTEFTPRYLFSRGERTNLVVRVRVRIDDARHQLHAGIPAFVRIDQGPDTAGVPASVGSMP
jgi:multidrug resistance efflux pump